MDTSRTKPERRHSTRRVESDRLAIAILSFRGATWLSVRADRKKGLSVEYSNGRALVNALRGPEPRLRLTYDSQAVSEPWLLTARVWNSGGVPIEARDV